MKTINAVTLANLALVLLVTFSASAQKSTVLATFSKNNIDAGILNADNIKRPDNYAFDFKQVLIAGGKQTTTVAKFDPSSPKAEQWTVISIDGKSPSKSDVNSFRKNQSKDDASTQPDDASYRIEKETGDYLVVSFKQDPNTVPKDVAFMKDCRSFLTINLRTKRLEQLQSINEKPVKIKILNAEKLNLVAKYNWDEQAKRYFSASENLDIQAKFLGQATNVQTVSEYSNYIKK